MTLTQRDLVDLRRLERRLVASVRRRRRNAEWRCFWSLPLGHRRNSLQVCMRCGHEARSVEPLFLARSRRYL
jgi:hypothetical protein